MPRLPIYEVLPRIKEALAAHASVVLQAPPGAGKTTIVPPELLKEPWLEGRSILILEPRRLAARAAAARMSGILGEETGETAGYRIRFESRVSSKTRIEVLTEGILTRRLQSDPGLEGVGLVIFDEFHERHIHADLALALSLDSRRQLREDLKILVMSATLDGEGISALLDKAPLISSAGRTYPVDLRYEKADPEGPLPETVAGAVVRALEKEPGDVLVFLPGAREIRRTGNLLKPAAARLGVEVFPLYGDLPWETQKKVLAPAADAPRKIVLATPIAETSLTIEGVSIVVDSGFVRVPEFNPANGLSRLRTVRISKTSAEQRAGRAGRLGPGICYRLWTEATQNGLVPRPVPEIRAADLAPLALELANWGAGDPASLSWLDPPPEKAMRSAWKLLEDLGALESDGRITEAGRAMAAMPLHPRLSHMVFEGDARGQGPSAADLAALLSERDIFSGDSRGSCDLLLRLDALRAFRKRGREGAAGFGADADACRRVDQAARQFGRFIKKKPGPGPGGPEKPGALLSFAYPDRVARQRNPGGLSYVLSSGRGASLPETENRLRSPFLVAANLDLGKVEGRIYLAAGIGIEDLRKTMAGRIKTEELIRWENQKERVSALREERLGELVLESGALSNPDPEKMRAAMLEGIRSMGIGALPWTPSLRQWQARVLSMRHWSPEEDWPDVSDAALGETLDEWLAPYLDGVTRREHLGRMNLSGILRDRLDRGKNQQLDREAPTQLTVPSGSRLSLEYRPGASPVLSVKLQEMFGLGDTPRVARGRVPVTLHLLSPARRPIQVTQDLRGFWERTYAEVKKELKGRYPKHPWPDDPWNAPPTRRTRRKKT